MLLFCDEPVHLLIHLFKRLWLLLEAAVECLRIQVRLDEDEFRSIAGQAKRL